MIRVLVILAVLTTVAEAQEQRVTILRDKAGKITGTIRSNGQRPAPGSGLAILCAHRRCEPPPPAVDESMPRLIPIRASRGNSGGPQLLPGPRFTNFVGPSPSKVSIPLPYPTVRIIQ